MERAAGGWWIPLALLLLASVATTSAQEASNDEVLFEFGRNITLRCNLPHEPSQPISWFRGEKSVDQIPELKDRYEVSEGGVVWSIHRAFEDDYGNYSCRVASNERKWTLLPAQIYGKLPQDTNVVEGQKLKLTCKLIGKPYPRVIWTYTTNVTAESGEDVRVVFGDRVSLRKNEQGAEDGELLLESAVRTDAGKFFCLADGYPSPARGGHFSRLRVKDMYAALWPFLGICAEVLVLCAVILVYERRRAKPELDDSDTDHQDQKKS